jgi:hypothetical protein
MRDGHNIIRRARIHKPVVLVDRRERDPFPLYANHPNWIEGERKVALKTGDYTVMGMEKLLALEPQEPGGPRGVYRHLPAASYADIAEKSQENALNVSGRRGSLACPP